MFDVAIPLVVELVLSASYILPLLLSGFYCAYEGSFLSNHFQYFFICLMFCPADFLHSSPSSHFKSLKSFISSFLIVHVSAPYSTTLHISVFIIRVFNVLFTFPLKSSLVFENASFPIAILLLISLWHLESVVITLP